MALEVMLQVTQPYHDASGAVAYDVGQRFPQDADLPEGLRTAPVIVEVPDAPAKAAPAKAAKASGS
jgi:hypothetical protein